MNTKERILETGRDLFNKIGVDNVSARTICTELHISPGNFTYYYSNKNDIIADLYQQMIIESQLALASMSVSDISIRVYLEAHREMFLIQEKYKFFYLNLFEILTNNSELKQRYIEQSKQEQKMAKDLLQLYSAKGILKKGITDNQCERMIAVGQILDKSWPVDAEILYKGNQKKKLRHYMIICCGLLEPYLSEKAAREYEQFFIDL
jgi:AcrR family transcriptional regulator